MFLGDRNIPPQESLIPLYHHFFPSVLDYRVNYLEEDPNTSNKSKMNGPFFHIQHIAYFLLDHLYS